MTPPRFHFRRDDVCPWWAAWLLDNPLRRALHNPERIVRGLVRPGETALDLGCGVGVFTLALARAVGARGTVIAADIQPRMLAEVERRASKSGLRDRIRTLLCDPDDLRLDRPIDLALAFWMLHEVPDPARLLAQVKERLKPGGRMLVVEPRLHVRPAEFAATLRQAEAAGLHPGEAAHIRWSYAALLTL